MTKLAMIPQGAMNILNPVMRIENQIMDALADHDLRLSKSEARQRVAQLLDLVELPAKVGRMYPHELSGGMKQRVCVAISISLGPKILDRRRADQRAGCGHPAPGDGHDHRPGEGPQPFDDPDRARHGTDGPGSRPAGRHVCWQAG